MSILIPLLQPDSSVCVESQSQELLWFKFSRIFTSLFLWLCRVAKPRETLETFYVLFIQTSNNLAIFSCVPTLKTSAVPDCWSPCHFLGSSEWASQLLVNILFCWQFGLTFCCENFFAIPLSSVFIYFSFPLQMFLVSLKIRVEFLFLVFIILGRFLRRWVKYLYLKTSFINFFLIAYWISLWVWHMGLHDLTVSHLPSLRLYIFIGNLVTCSLSTRFTISIWTIHVCFWLVFLFFCTFISPAA